MNLNQIWNSLYGAACLAPDPINCCNANDFGTLGSKLSEFASTEVLCANGRVINVVWQGVGLIGKIPTAFNKLTALEELRLNNMQVTGHIPDIIGSTGLAKMRILMLNGLLLTGSIPSTVASLKTLKSLLLSDNLLSGTIHALKGTLN